MTFILPFGQAHGDQAWRTGPKAARLSELSTAGFRIPAGFAITTDALDYFLASNGLTDEIASALKRFDELRFDELGNEPAHLRKRLIGGDLPEDLGEELRRSLGELGDGPVALRSSSTLEDRADFSFAGQHDSCLNLQYFDECAAALKTVWASLYSDRAISYLRALDRSTQPLRMGVVLQKLVAAQSAGVAFTVHPVSGDYEQVYISAALGLGESTVSGAVTPDEILVSRAERKTLRYTVGAKASKVVADEAGGTRQAAVGADDQQAQALDETQVAQIAELALNVEEQMGNNPQDVEWAYRDGELFLLQARPMVQTAEQGITWQAPIPGSHWRRNWRLGEWLPEAVTPLFSSWVLPMLVAARENFGTGRLGWKHRPAFSMPHPWFCIVNGHFYTRQDFPDWNKGKNGKEQTEEEKRAEHTQRMEGGKKHLRNWHGKLLPDYVEHFAKHRQVDFSKRSGQELLDFVEMLAEEAGEIWFIIAPIGYGFEEMGFKAHYEEKIPEEGRVHFSALFSGYPSRIFDAQQALYELATKVREQESLADKLFAETAITDLPAWLQQRLAEYAAEYGHQLASLDFFWPTTGEDQAQLCQTLGVFAQQDLEAPEAQRQRTAQRRDDSVATVLAQLADDERATMAALIDYYQTNASVREDANFYFQLGWPLMRAAVLELAQRLVKAGVLTDTDAVFFLEKDELQGAVAALENSAAISLQQVAAGRQRTWQEQRQLDAPDMLGEKEEDDRGEKGYFDDEEGRRIIAQGVSPGICRGRVRIAQPGDKVVPLEKGEILVTHAASPQLTPLMLMAGALVVEVGGGASHSSLVARELGLPAIVDAPQAIQVLTDGMLVEVDGARGVLRIIEE